MRYTLIDKTTRRLPPGGWPPAGPCAPGPAVMIITGVPGGTRPADVRAALAHAWHDGRLTGDALAMADRTRGGCDADLHPVPDRAAPLPAAVPAIAWPQLTPPATSPAPGLPRPAVDPAIPAADRQLLTGPGAPLVPASSPPPARGRHCPLWAVSAAVAVAWLLLGLCLPHLLTAISGQSAPVLILAETTTFLCFLLALPATAITVKFAMFTPAAAARARAGRTPAAKAARRWHGRYLTPADFDPAAAALLARAQHAIGVITATGIFRDGLLDGPADGSDLTAHEWDIARTLAGLTQVRKDPAPATAAELHAIADTQASVTARIAALETYAAEVAAAETAWQAWQADTRPELGDGAADLLAATAGHDHATAALHAQAQRATAARHALHELTTSDPARARGAAAPQAHPDIHGDGELHAVKATWIGPQRASRASRRHW